MATYTYCEPSGHREILDAETMADALEEAVDLCQSGEWGTDGASIEITVIESDTDGVEIDREYLTVEIEPDHDALIRAAGGDTGCDHDWTSEGEDGCRENPGVWSTGGTGISISSHCRRCGLRRTEHLCGAQRNPGDHDTVEYSVMEGN